MINLKFFKALAVFIITIIGVGIFGLPYVAMKAGFWIVAIYFLAMAAIAIIIHLFLGEIALGTEEPHRLPGYAEKYLGGRWKKISLFVTGLALTGALLAYLIVGGEFLTLLLAPYFGGNTLIYTLLFFSAGAFFIWRGIGVISRAEIFFSAAFLVILVLFFLMALPFINPAHFEGANFQFLALPYGVILFSLWGSAIVPEIKEMLGKDKHLLRPVLISGILLSALAYLFFIAIVLGVSGPNTTMESLSGLNRILGGNIFFLGLVFGIITCFTSFLPLGLTLRKILWYDFNFPSRLAWFVACFLPLFLFLAGFKKFIDVIGITGALAIGMEGVIIVFLYRQFLKKKFSRQLNPLAYILVASFILGVLFEVYYFVGLK